VEADDVDTLLRKHTRSTEIIVVAGGELMRLLILKQMKLMSLLFKQKKSTPWLL
jgi:peptidase E